MLGNLLQSLLWKSFQLVGWQTIALGIGLLFFVSLLWSTVTGLAKKHAPKLMVASAVFGLIGWFSLPAQPPTPPVVYRPPVTRISRPSRPIELPKLPEMPDLSGWLKDQFSGLRMPEVKPRELSEAEKAAIEKQRLEAERKRKAAERAYAIAAAKAKRRYMNNVAMMKLAGMFNEWWQAAAAEDARYQAELNRLWASFMQPHVITLPPGSQPVRR